MVAYAVSETEGGAKSFGTVKKTTYSSKFKEANMTAAVQAVKLHCESKEGTMYVYAVDTFNFVSQPRSKKLKIPAKLSSLKSFSAKTLSSKSPTYTSINST